MRQIGWNAMNSKGGARGCQGIPKEDEGNLVKSYYLRAEDEAMVAAATEYGVPIHASVERKNVFACQFHPEKSGDVGLRILENFIQLS